jgi:hypothetical protein
MAIRALTVSWDKLALFTNTRRDAIRKDIDVLYRLVANEEAYDQKKFGRALGVLKNRLSGS